MLTIKNSINISIEILLIKKIKFMKNLFEYCQTSFKFRSISLVLGVMTKSHFCCMNKFISG